MSVKITALEAENVKRIKAVALTPSPTGLTIVGGNNNQGKTSVLDALAWSPRRRPLPPGRSPAGRRCGSGASESKAFQRRGGGAQRARMPA